MKNERNSNFELLRILSMVLIVMHHLALHGGAMRYSPPYLFNDIFIQIISIGGKIGVNCFILISAYFLILKPVKFKKILFLLSQVFVASLFCSFVYIYINGMSNVSLLNILIPFLNNGYWFVFYFILLLLIAPFLNSFLISLEKNKFKSLINFSFLFLSLIPSFIPLKFGFSNFTWFIFVYMIGAYIRLYDEDIMYINNIKKIVYFRKKTYIFISIFIMSFSILLMDFLSYYSSVFIGRQLFFSNINSVFVIFCSLWIFSLFKNRSSFYSKKINHISQSMLMVYLLHDNHLLREILWEKINIKILSTFNYFPFISMCIVLLIMSISVFIDILLMRYLYERFFTILYIFVRKIIIFRIKKLYF